MKSSIVVLLVPLSLLVAADAKPTGTTDCNEFCTRQYRPLCGTDGVTYDNLCVLEFVACKYKPDLRVAYLGKCKTEKDGIKCPNGDCGGTSSVKYISFYSDEDENQGHAARQDVDYEPVVDTIEYTDSHYEDGNLGHAARDGSKCPNDDCPTIEYTDSDYEDVNLGHAARDGSKCPNDPDWPNPNDCPTIEYTDSDYADVNLGQAARDGSKCPNDDCSTIEYTDSDYEDVNLGYAARDGSKCPPDCDTIEYNDYTDCLC